MACRMPSHCIQTANVTTVSTPPFSLAAEAALIDVGRRMLAAALAWGTSGNLSTRLGDDAMLVSASGTALGAMAPGDFVEVRLGDGQWAGARKPSKEVPMHRGIYLARPEAQVVLHSSPHYATLLACSGEAIPSELFIETMYYLERIAWVDYAHPGSEELGDSVRRAAAGAEVIMMRNHGVILFDRSADEALLRLQVLEMTCKMLVEAKAAGIALKKIPPEVVREFLHSGRYKPRQPWHR
jgi:ribulose-5-phosphate 4-epimerase/fuculose-1-phosphate aldolase